MNQTIQDANEARTHLAALEAEARDAALRATAAVEAFEANPTTESATAKLVAEQAAKNATTAHQRYEAETRSLRRRDDQERAGAELAKLLPTLRCDVDERVEALEVTISEFSTRLSDAVAALASSLVEAHARAGRATTLAMQSGTTQRFTAPTMDATIDEFRRRTGVHVAVGGDHNARTVRVHLTTTLKG